MSIRLFIFILAFSAALAGCDGDTPAGNDGNDRNNRNNQEAPAIIESRAGAASPATEAALSPDAEKALSADQNLDSAQPSASVSQAGASQVVATVNGSPVSRQILESQKAMAEADGAAFGQQADLSGREGEEAEADRQLESELLGNLITLEIACQEALRLGYAPTDEKVDEALKAIEDTYQTPEDLKNLLNQYGAGEDDVRAQLIKTLALKKWQENHFLAQIKVSEQEARQFYDQHQEAFRHGELARVSQIFLSVPLVGTPAQIEKARSAALAKGEAVQNRLKAGEDFGAVAAELSDDPNAAENRGDMGWMEKDQSFLLFDKAIFEMKIGQVSDLLDSPMGFYVFKLTATKPAGLEPFDSARPQIAEYLSRQKLQTVLQDKMTELFQKADIQIFDPELKKIYESWSMDDATEATDEKSAGPAGNPDQTP